jgi:hypothetical protein
MQGITPASAPQGQIHAFEGENRPDFRIEALFFE